MKRKHSEQPPAGMRVDIPSDFDAPQLQAPLPPLSPVSALHVPGQWPRIIPNNRRHLDPSATAPTFFTTVSKLASIVALKHLVRLPCTYVAQFFRERQIRVDTIIRDDGAVKKRLIDMGPVGLSTPTRTRPSNSNAHRAKQPLRHRPLDSPQHNAVLSPASPILDSAAVPNGDVAAVMDLEDFSFSSDGSPPLTSTPRRLPEPISPVQSPITVPHEVAMHVDFDNCWPLEKAHTSKTFAPAPSNIFPPTVEGSQEAGDPIKPAAPVRKKLVMTNPTKEQVHRPFTIKMRTTFLSPSRLSPNRGAQHESHTKVSTPLDRHLPITFNNSDAKKMQWKLKYEASRKANAAKAAALGARLKASADLRAEGAQARNSDEAATAANNTKNEVDDTKNKVDADADNGDLHETSEYDNDLSMLPDAPPAPPKKTVSWTQQLRAKPFYRDSLVGDMQDSILEDIKSSDDLEHLEATKATMQLRFSQLPASEESPCKTYSTNAEHGSSTGHCASLGLVGDPTVSFSNDQSASSSEGPSTNSVEDSSVALAESPKSVSFAEDPSFEEDPSVLFAEGSSVADPDGPSLGSASTDDNVSHGDQSTDQVESVGFRGVPTDTCPSNNEGSLGEIHLSLEVVDELYEEVEQKLKLAPPKVEPTPTPAPAPTIKPLVAALTAQEQDILDAAAKATDHGKDRTAHVVPHKLTAHDFGTLLPTMFNGSDKAWLNDNIINEYLAVLVEHEKKKVGFQHKASGPAPPVHAFASQWYTNMKKEPKSVERWARRRQLGGEQLLDAKLILFPVCDDAHWRLLAIKPQKRRIEYYDSLAGSGTKYTDVALEWLKMELGVHFVAGDWQVVKEQRSTIQVNAKDCGVFAVLNGLVLLRGEEHQRVVASDGMEDARRRMAVTLLAGQPTTELE